MVDTAEQRGEPGGRLGPRGDTPGPLRADRLQSCQTFDRLRIRSVMYPVL